MPVFTSTSPGEKNGKVKTGTFSPVLRGTGEVAHEAGAREHVDGSDRLAAQATAAVLEVVSSVSDGELVATGTGPERAFSVVRRLAGAEQQDLPPTVTGRYLVTLLPDEARFAYRLEVRNPARGHRRFEIALREAEHVEGVDAPVAWDAEGARYRFDLPPGDTALTIRGRLTEARFAPPVAASLQYLLLESHPLIRPDLATQAKRVGVGETGLTARFRGAQAFLLDGGAGAPGAEVAWKATRLEALKTAGLALHRLSQVFFLGADGVARGESSLAIDNQGAPALTLRGASRPTFASVGGEPAFLTHDAMAEPTTQGRFAAPLTEFHRQPVSSSPLIEPDVRISRIRLSDRSHAQACSPTMLRTSRMPYRRCSSW